MRITSCLKLHSNITRFNDLIKKINEKDEIIDGLVKDVSKLKTKIDQIESDIYENVEEEKNGEPEPYDEVTVEKKAKEFCMKNIELLDDMEKEIKKSRKNYKDKAKIFTDKMVGEIDNFGLMPAEHNRHHFCVFEVFEMKDALKKMDSNNEREKILKLIELFRGNYKLVHDNKPRLWE